MKKLTTSLLLCCLYVVSFAQEHVQVGREFNVGTTPAEATIYVYNGPYRTEKQLVEEVMTSDPSGQPWYKKLGEGTFTIEPREHDDDMITLVAVYPGLYASC